MPIRENPDRADAAPVGDDISKLRPCAYASGEIAVTIGVELGLLRHINSDRRHVEIAVGRPGKETPRPRRPIRARPSRSCTPSK